jgi:hypothetical protein
MITAEVLGAHKFAVLLESWLEARTQSAHALNSS